MMRHDLVVASLACIAISSAAMGALADGSPSAATPTAGPVHALLLQSTAPSQKDTPPGEKETPLTREEIIKQGPAALETNCTKCHGSDKWEGTNRDHDGWAAIVASMQAQMAQAQMPPLSEKTSNLIVDYLTLTHPQ